MSVDSVHAVTPCTRRKLLGARNVKALSCVNKMHNYLDKKKKWLISNCGLGSSVGIATGYGLDGLGIKTRWGQDFPHPS